MNTGASWPTADVAAARVLRMQAKLHQWASDDADRRFADLFNLVADPAFLLTAWRRVRSNRGARSAGVDGHSAHAIEAERGEESFLAELRADLRARTFRPLPVRERMIRKARRQGPPAWHPDRPGSGGTGRAQAGARAHLRGGFQAMLVWLPPRAPRSGRHRRDPLSDQPLL